ncbi:sterile alpha motif domain-containing protein 3 isoform X2 [Oreochromis niloticus]|nr:sterile alpha motif domain-containing protein 3 isoform X2 [Oreochromis niloticus]XP_019210444.1 sterile alpha motif domain-containing protein 3-like isoform X2 [Oreochromis niloticus]XP_019214647.1 sterile alpha motif domain-containing protein 3-like isoform X2 [Oreochromis niloticus]XP_019219705.1 sterile alpha motif domain-containing protein 3-like isoform X2 [Oreochromis niloticus]XP_019221610.1 sterile alpha motif domain-containing protein 3 isoform X2 [Oreochromis niloticus]CAI5656587
MATRDEMQAKEMTANQKMTMRVILTEADIRKVILHSRPSTVKDLITKLRESLGLQYNFSLQFQDPEFNNELCNLTDLQELPEKPTIKVLPVFDLVPVSSDDVFSDTSTADTEILSHSPQDRREPWPEFFDIPTFSVDVEYRLRQADLLFMSEGTHLKVSKELKHEILERLAESMYSYTAYPTAAQFESVATALINKHPCLQERGSVTRCCGWKNSLKHKMGNYRTKRRQSGCLDVAVNAGKRGRHSSDGQPANKRIKKAKKGEINYLPNFPDGFDQAALEEARKDLADEMQKRTPNGLLVKQKMDQTFALRRKEVVDSEPPINMMVKRWPALFTEDQVFMEFSRIVGKNLKQEFYENIDRHSPRFLELFRSKRGNVGQLLTQISQQTNTTDPTAIRTQVLRGLPIILGDNPSTFFKAGFESDADFFRDLDIGILLTEREEAVLTSAQHPSPTLLKIIIEGEVVMENIQDLPKAMCILFGLTYALHLNYPKSMKLTFLFIQQILLSLGHTDLKPKIQSLKNQLTM